MRGSFLASPLWAITSYFNPAGYSRRLANYRRFRRSLSVPLVTVELSFGDTFELGPGDAEVLVQIRGRDVMWQKERLLNLAVARLPRHCDYIAWIDCDVVFDDDEWPERARQAFENHVLLQLFDERCDLPRDVDPLQASAHSQAPRAESVAGRIFRGTAEQEELAGADSPFQRGSTAGLAWGCWRQVIERHGLFDACILGNGDRAMLCAALGEFDSAVRATAMNEARRLHYLAWARPFHATVRARVRSISGRIYHLWHGDLRDRRYRERHTGFSSFDFDPSADLAMDDSGVWRWSSAKPEMHAFVRDYFHSRREDGPG